MLLDPQIARVAALNFTQDLDLSGAELVTLLDLADEVKRRPLAFAPGLNGRSVALLFEKPSLRTKVTFELAVQQLGGSVVTLDGPIAVREPLKDIARNLDRWVHAIVARTFAQKTIDGLAEWASVPVINALSDKYHPCQALADMQTLRQRFGDLRGRKLVFIGDGNNVAHSLMLCCARLGMDFTAATPPGYEADPQVVAQAREIAASHRATIDCVHDCKHALTGADAVYTDVWTSMGQEREAAERCFYFADYQVNDQLMDRAKSDAVFMHCLPAKRGEEVTESVIESPRSVVFQQAENRLHTQKALLLMLLA